MSTVHFLLGSLLAESKDIYSNLEYETDITKW